MQELTGLTPYELRALQLLADGRTLQSVRPNTIIHLRQKGHILPFGQNEFIVSESGLEAIKDLLKLSLIGERVNRNAAVGDYIFFPRPLTWYDVKNKEKRSATHMYVVSRSNNTLAFSSSRYDCGLGSNLVTASDEKVYRCQAVFASPDELRLKTDSLKGEQ